MFPVLDSEISELNIDSQSDSYRRMLYKQFEFIKSNKVEIITKAEKLYNKILNGDTFYSKISCDLKIILSIYQDYKK